MTTATASTLYQTAIAELAATFKTIRETSLEYDMYMAQKNLVSSLFGVDKHTVGLDVIKEISR